MAGAAGQERGNRILRPVNKNILPLLHIGHQNVELGCRYAKGHCPNNPGQSQVQGGAKLRNRSRRHPRGAKPRTDVRRDRGRADRELIIPRAGAALLGMQRGSRSGSIVTSNARGHARLRAVRDFL